MRKFSTPSLILTCALALSLCPAAASAGQTTSQRTRQRRVTNAAQPSPTPSPIVVPRLAPTSTPPSAGGSAAPSSAPSQTPAATPTPAQPPSSAPRPAQSPSEETIEDDEVIRVTSNLVVVPVSATDAKGEPVRDLKVPDFRLEEEGRVQEIAQIGDPDQVPLDIAILLDVSSSVAERFEFEQQAAARFLKEVLKPIDRAAVYAIRERGQLEQALASAESATAKLTSIPAAKGPTPTAFYDSVVGAAKYLAQNTPSRNRRVIVVISDGEDNFSDRIRESAVSEYVAASKAATEEEKQAVRKVRRRQQDDLHRKALADVQREVQRADAVFY
ncbi:MAG: VWA domain-containing protein, partial [Pyrinomonadaceae bacterium]